MLEKGKNAALALLFALMIFLLYISLTIGPAEGSGGFLSQVLGGTPPGDDADLSPQMAVEVRKIAVCTPTGVYLPQNGEQKEELQTAVSSIYAEALGSAGEVREITRQEYYDALSFPALYLAFDTGVPLELLMRWVGVEGEGQDATLHSLVVTSGGERVTVAYYDAATGTYCAADTAAGVDRLTQVCSSWEGGSALFAFQDGDFAALCGDEPVHTQALTAVCYNVLPPDYLSSGSLPREVLTGFGYNPFLARVYDDASGDLVYVEENNVLRMSAQGDLTYTAGGQGIYLGLREQESGDAALVLEGVRRLLVYLCEQTGAGGQYSLREMIEEESGAVQLIFDLFLDGCPVNGDTPAAHATVQDGRITYLRLSPRKYEAAGERGLLTVRQAAAALQGGHNLRLDVRYSEKSDGTLLPALYSTED